MGTCTNTIGTNETQAGGNNCGGSGNPDQSYVIVCTDSDYALTICWESIQNCPPTYANGCSLGESCPCGVVGG